MPSPRLSLVLSFLIFMGSTMFAAAPAHADAFEQQFKKEAVSIPRELIRLKYVSFGPIVLKDFVAWVLAPTTHIKAASLDWVIKANGDGRSSAHWDRKTNTIYVARENYDEYQDKDWFGFHETASLYGIFDKDYFFTTGCWMLAQAETQLYFHKSEKARLVEWIEMNAEYAAKGGIIGLGGGGEILGGGTTGMLKLGLRELAKKPSPERRARVIEVLSYYLTTRIPVYHGSVISQLGPKWEP